MKLIHSMTYILVLGRARLARGPLLALFALAIVAAGVAAQESAGMPQASQLAQQNLRPYWHVFAAYTIVIALVGGWAVSIARRLRSIEERLVD
jgi:CcmD family protein